MDQKEIEVIIRGTLEQHSHLIESSRNKNRLFEWCKIALMPLVITLITIFASIHLDGHKARLLKAQAIQRAEQTERIATLAKETIVDIFRRQHEAQYLSQIKDIYLEIVRDDYHLEFVRDELLRSSGASEGLEHHETLINKIKSLEAYKTTALPFLVNLSQYYNNNQDDSKSESQVIGGKIDKTIFSILSGSQIDISNKEFIGQEKNKRMMRFANFENYNMHENIFKHCNLYSSVFSRSLLTNAKFTHSDLYNSNFTHANLNGTIFKNSNLRNVNFLGAAIENASFTNCDLNGAYFPFDYLLTQLTSTSPTERFSMVDKQTKISLLARHVEKLEKLLAADGNDHDQNEKQQKLKNLLSELGLDADTSLGVLKEYNRGKVKT